MKNVIVVFTKNNARVLVNPEKFPKDNYILNPDLSLVKGIPPHLWKLNKDGQIIPMKGQEIHNRLVDIEKHGSDNDIKLAQENSNHTNWFKRIIRRLFK